MDGDAGALRENEDVKEFYLGALESGTHEFSRRQVLQRRKRWLA